MKLRESGMPEEQYWETLLDANAILGRLDVGPRLGNVLEIGCGYGTFTIPVARRVSGVVTALDIDPDMVEMTRLRASRAGLANVDAIVRDAHADGFGVPPRSQDACLLFNLLHCEEPELLLAGAARAVRTGGEVLAIHWRYDPDTPRGPAMAIRPRPGQIIEWAEATGALKAAGGAIDLPRWHYGLVFTVQHPRVANEDLGGRHG